MAGIPIFAGFFAKLVLFSETIQAGYLALVIVAVVNSIISVGYYFKLILAMYTKDANEERKGTSVIIYAVAVIAIVLNIALGLFPSLVLDILA
jgi:NADH-quinone oxidoreductase subunit N